MIQLLHVSKKFKNEVVLKDINYKFPNKGLFAICGASGCGKTTLLNSLSTLLDIDGDLLLDGTNYNKIGEKEKNEIRNNKIGFVFQDYKLFEFDSVKDNLLLALDMKTNEDSQVKNKRIKDLLKIVGLKNKENELVSNLSGGEKQRIALCRALINSPKVLLADEPTGNLDNENSEIVMNLLLRASKTSLVIMVSHDLNLVSKYADKILFMKDGEFIKEKDNHHLDNVEPLPLIKVKTNENNAKLPMKFCISHAINSIKKRKWRTAFIIATISLGLIGVGLGTLITNIISTNLYESYTSIIEPDKVIISSNDTYQSRQLINALDHDEANEIYNEYKDSATSIGTYYYNNFMMMFTDYAFSLNFNQNNKLLPLFSPQFFNDYMLLSDCKNVIYPEKITDLDDDEIILGLSKGMLNEICYQMQIVRTVETFSEYLKKHELNIDVSLSNYNWNFSTEMSFKIVGFAMTNHDCFIHSNSCWNEYVFERKCHFSTTNIINANTSHPWDIKKVYYLNFESNRDSFLRDLRYKEKYLYVVGEILSKEYYPLLCENLRVEDCNRVGLFYLKQKDIIPLSYIDYIKSLSQSIQKVVPGSPSTYVMYSNNLMMGFAKHFYLSYDSNYLENIIDLTSYIDGNDVSQMNTPDNVLLGYFAKSDGISFNPKYKLDEGRRPDNYNEIVVSQGLINKLNLVSPINKSLYACFPKDELLLPNGFLKRNYEMTDIKIVGISNSQKIEINHNEEWPILFFQTKLSISSFSLIANSLALSVDEEKIDDVIAKVSRGFPNLIVESPINGVKASINEVCNYIQTILLIVSISSILISAILLTMCNYLHFMEVKKDIGLARCLGVSKKESKKLVFTHSLIMSLFSFVLSTIEILLLCVVLSQSFSTALGVEATFVFNPMSILYMFVLSIGISFLSSSLISKKITSLSALECLN